MLLFLLFQSCAFGFKFSRAATSIPTTGFFSSFSQPIHSTIITTHSGDRGSTKSLLLYMAISDKKVNSATSKSKVEKKSTSTAPLKKRKVSSEEAIESSTSSMVLELELVDPINKKKADKEKAAPNKSKKDITAFKEGEEEKKSRSKTKEISNKKSISKMTAEDRNLIVSDILSVIMQEVGDGDSSRRFLDRELDISDDEKGGRDDTTTTSSNGGDNNNKHNKLLNGVVRIYCTHSLPNFGLN